jgi:predicted O-methyltransferase YrrM
MQDWIAHLFQNPDFLRMGHFQRGTDQNLGLGWIYYGLARVLRPQRVVVIGSWRGFVPLILAKALKDNLEGGKVTFVDPSLVDNFWKDPGAIDEHFQQYGVDNIEHYLMTTQEFVTTEAYKAISDVGMLFVDGYHSREQAEIDFEAFDALLSPNGVALFHDTARIDKATIYGKNRTYEHRVKDYVEELGNRQDLEMFNLPFDRGVTLVRRRQE